MSTIDPAIAKAERAQRGMRKPAAWWVVVVLVVIFLAGAGLGYGWTSVGAIEVIEPPVLAAIGVVAGIPVLIGGMFAWTNIIMRRREFGKGYGLSATSLGASIGVLFEAQPGDAVAYAIAGSLFIIAIVWLFFGFSAARSRKAAGEREQEMMRTGRLTTATVTDKGHTKFGEGTRILTSVTFTFTDAFGVQRWVQRSMVIRFEDPLQEGAQSRLWYDASDPGNDKKIVVEIAVNSTLDKVMLNRQ